MAVTFGVITDVLAAIKATLEEVFATRTTTVTVMKDSEETTHERVMQIASRGPTILVAWGGIESSTYATRKRAQERFYFGVFAGPVPSTADDNRTTASDIVAEIAHVVVETVVGNDWGVDGVDKATDCNCLPEAVAEEGYALVAGTWTQSIDLPGTIDPSTLENLTSVYSTATLPDSPDGETKDEFSTTIPQE